MTTPVKPEDFTGKQRAKLLKEQAEEVAKRQEEMSLAVQAQNEAVETEILDVTANAAVPQVVDEVQVLETDADDTEVIRVADDVQGVTIGDKTYDFVAGRKYKVEKNVADVLRWAGRLYDRA